MATLAEEYKINRKISKLEDYIANNCDGEIGMVYGKLKIIELDKERSIDSIKNNKSQYKFFKCECQCENKTIKSVVLNALRSGHTSSCGCSKKNNPLVFDDLTGKTFGRLTVIKRDEERDNKLREEKGRSQVHWLCKCSCGNKEIKSISSYQLKSGETVSCGCYNRELTAERNRRDKDKINRVFHTKVNTYEFKEDYVIGVNNETKEEFLISKEDYEFIKNWYWRKDKKGYWIANDRKSSEVTDIKNVKMHQLVAERMYGEYNHRELFPDHLSRDKSDNRRTNLELKSNIDNMKNRSLSKANKSGKTGVYFSRPHGKYVAAITINYKTKHLGYFNTFEEAVAARKEAEELYGFTCDEVTAADLKE